ncbi:beta-crystallin A2-like [Haliotis rubra]|uniref:beta-crystallin A2-like n=1 Tax=Haliotis rubra TaxID=36100 RepID=UPI001EE61355|nr:beta-crystallin A2-like [Haliotis rubra]
MANWGGSPKVTLFEKPNFCGCRLEVYRNLPELGNFDNSVSSAVVHEGDWALYSEIKYSGARLVIKEGQCYATLPGVNNAASSICKM